MNAALLQFLDSTLLRPAIVVAEALLKPFTEGRVTRVPDFSATLGENGTRV